VFSTITAVVGVFALSVGLEGYFKKRIALISRFFMVASALLLLFVGNVSDVIGILIIGITILYEIRAKEISTAKNISS
jgi:TRAP-type uncharacterized transport system fused permease subunit